MPLQLFLCQFGLTLRFSPGILFRFFYQLRELTPAMLARFTQVDYDREMALVAVDETAGAPAIIGVARYIMGPDQESAAFAVVLW